MSQYGTIYRLAFLTAQEDVTVTVNIFDTEHLIPDADEPTVYPLIPTGNPFKVKTINNSRTKYGVFSKQAAIEFYSTVDINAYTFVDSKDNRWLVEAKTDAGEMIFTGFVELADVTRPFLPNPSAILLTASDMLGILADQEITYDNGTTKLVGEYRLAELLALSFKKTGLRLPIHVSNNIRIYNGGFSPDTEHLYDTVYVNALVTVVDVQESIKCFDLIEIIADKDVFIVQYRNAWWIMRPDDFDDSNVYITVFDADGANPVVQAGATYNKNIGIIEAVKFIDAVANTEYSRPIKYSKHTFPLNIPVVPYNSTFEFGDLVNTISPTQKQFALDGWICQQNLSSPGPPACDMFIERLYDSLDRETERYLLLTSPVSPTSNNMATCAPIPVNVNDKFDFSADFAWAQDISGGGTYTQRVATIRLVADDGSFWMLDSDGVWYQSNVTWSVNFKDLEYQFVPNDQDEREFVTKEVKAKQIPRTGFIWIDLYALNQIGSAIDDVDIHFTNLRFDYMPFTNGSYVTYDKAVSKVQRSELGYAANLDEEVQISDPSCLNRLVTGTMLRQKNPPGTVFSGSVTFLAGNSFEVSGWQLLLFTVGMPLIIASTVSNNITTRVLKASYDSGSNTTTVTIPDATVAEVSGTTTIDTFLCVPVDSFFNATPWNNGDPPDTTYVMPFEKIRVFSTFNQDRNSIRYFQGNLYGLGLDWPDMIHKYFLTDADPDTTPRRFMILGLEQNWKSCQWTANFAETFHDSGKVYTDDFTFKYLNG